MNFKHNFWADILSIQVNIFLVWMWDDLIDGKSTLGQLMAWYRQATSHYLNQCWPRSLLVYDITRPQWVSGIYFIIRYCIKHHMVTRADSRLVPSQWEMSLQCNSHWLVTNLESAMVKVDLRWGYELTSRPFHSPSLVAGGLSVGYETWLLIGWYDVSPLILGILIGWYHP